ncbi:uncharacterized protein [Diadema antillarum]|uniref:uncharacterized protein n=1 Tax=Diadema antillarum TaxID=105358 RepID=UPI003A87BCAE
MEIEKLHRIGESTGLSGSELREFIAEEQKRAREERAEERERVKREQKLTQLKLDLEREKGNSGNGSSEPHVRPPKLPTFDEAKDNLDTYLNRFERYARAQSWPQSSWAINLSALLTGKALDTYARLTDEEAGDYEAVKAALLKRYDLTSEGFRRKLRSAKPEAGSQAGASTGQRNEASKRPGCHICGKIGHIARNCYRRNKPPERLAAGVSASNDDSPHPSGQDSGAPVPNESDVQATGELRSDDYTYDAGQFSTQVVQMEERGMAFPVMSAACGAKPIRKMPVVEGHVNGKPVQVLRDSGCSTAVIRTDLVQPQQMTDEWRTIDGTTRRFQVARVRVDTPYLVGELDVLCMNNPVYPLILGNVQGVRNPGDPDCQWKPVELLEAVETRQQKEDKTKPLRALKVPGQVSNVTPDDFRREQKADATLDKLRQHATSGVQADVQRFCRSCDACQRAIPKGRVTKIPLGTTPIIDEPFHRVAIDIVGPIKPVSSRGHRYILTLVDYATRYPEAVPLRNIDTSSVAEALLSIYSRVGFPKEMLTDRGSQFTSDVMREVSRLLSIRHVTTTPYHPQCNGLVEKFNGTLKRMLNKMCEERPTDWDRYIDALLFAYRETPQDSTGFAPFELLYGRVVRGPLMIVKELWTQDDTEADTKSTYQYVLDLKERMEKTCDIARQELLKSHEKV